MLTIVTLVMQALAVLLLEMAYEGKHLKDTKDDIIACIKKMIRWLHVMKFRDPVSARAHAVVYKILNTCAPALREQVKELVADDVDWIPQPTQPARPARSKGSSKLNPQSDSWNASGGTDFPQEMPPNFPPPLSQDQFLDPLLQYPLPTAQSTPFVFGNPFMTPFDQGVPIVDLQQLWWHSAPFNSLNLDVSGVNPSQQQLMQQQMQHQMHEQMQPTDPMEQQDEGGALSQPPS